MSKHKVKYNIEIIPIETVTLADGNDRPLPSSVLDERSRYEGETPEVIESTKLGSYSYEFPDGNWHTISDIFSNTTPKTIEMAFIVVVQGGGVLFSLDAGTNVHGEICDTRDPALLPVCGHLDGSQIALKCSVANTKVKLIYQTV